MVGRYRTRASKCHESDQKASEGIPWLFRCMGADASVIFGICLICKMPYKRVKWILRRYTVICMAVYVGCVLGGKNAI